MATRLDVVNACLAIMGEAPLNALAEDHEFKQAALFVLDRNDKTIQGKGWWYNTENLRMVPNPTDNRIYLPGDAGTVYPLPSRPHLVQRGRVVYDLKNGTDIFPPGFAVEMKLIRIIPFEDTPVTINSYIERKTVLDFQLEYDGDQTKTRNLKEEVYGDGQRILGKLGEANAEHIRNIRVNFIDESRRFGRIRNIISYSSRPR